MRFKSTKCSSAFQNHGTNGRKRRIKQKINIKLFIFSEARAESRKRYDFVLVTVEFNKYFLSLKSTQNNRTVQLFGAEAIINVIGSSILNRKYGTTFFYGKLLSDGMWLKRSEFTNIWECKCAWWVKRISQQTRIEKKNN